VPREALKRRSGAREKLRGKSTVATAREVGVGLVKSGKKLQGGIEVKRMVEQTPKAKLRDGP